MIRTYTITEREHGVLFMESMDVNLLMALFKYYKKHYGYDILDGLIARHYSAAFCLTDREGAKIWSKQIGLEDI